MKVSTPHRTSTANTLLGINGTDNYPYLTVISNHDSIIVTNSIFHTSVLPEQYNNSIIILGVSCAYLFLCLHISQTTTFP